MRDLDLVNLNALTDVLHTWVHPADPQCVDPDCIEGVYTAEEIAAVVLAAGWNPPATLTDWRGWSARVGLRKPTHRAAVLAMAEALRGVPYEWTGTPKSLRQTITEAAATLDGLPTEMREERSRRLDDGWVPFGWHVVYPDVQLEFDGSDGTGLPVWERNREWTTREASIESFAHAMARRRRMAQIEARPCCHTTGPFHHPACQEGK